MIADPRQNERTSMNPVTVAEHDQSSAAIAELRRNAGLLVQHTGSSRDLRDKIPGPAPAA